MALNIRQRQSDALLRMLNLHSTAAASRDASDLYKILVMDRFCKDVIAPLLRVSELRKQGVTLHLMLEAERQPVPEVPAIYFVQATPANIDRIAQDAGQSLYDTMHVSFATAASNRLLEQLASAAVRNGGVAKLTKLFDEYLAFIALEPSLFSLGLPHTYVELNDPQAKDTQIEACISGIVDGLFSVLVTLGVVPIIRCPPGGAAEAAAAALDVRLRDALKGRSNLFSEGPGSSSNLTATLSRPLLVLFDRNFDLSAMLQHAWSYKPLVQDVLGLKLNRVTLSDGGGAAAGPAGAAAAALLGGGKKSYEVDDKDFFWEMCGGMPFPKVAEEVESQLQKYKAAVDEINAQTAAGGGGEVVDHDEMMRRNTQHLMNAVSSLPELQEKKKVLDKHTNLATALLGAIKERGLDQLYNMEEDLLTGKADWPGVMRALQGPKGSPGDKLRLLLVALLAAESLPPESDLLELRGACLEYLLHLRRNKLVGEHGSTSAAAGSGLGGGGGAAGQGGAGLLDWADKALGSGFTTVTKSVKNLLSGQRQAPVAAALEALMEGKQGTPVFDGFRVFDPRLPPGRAGLDRARGPFREALTFMIGGGNYLEREALVAWASRATPQRQVLYGATDMLTGQEFLKQLEDLANRSGFRSSSSSSSSSMPGPS